MQISPTDRAANYRTCEQIDSNKSRRAAARGLKSELTCVCVAVHVVCSAVWLRLSPLWSCRNHANHLDLWLCPALAIVFGRANKHTRPGREATSSGQEESVAAYIARPSARCTWPLSLVAPIIPAGESAPIAGETSAHLGEGERAMGARPSAPIV